MGSLIMFDYDGVIVDSFNQFCRITGETLTSHGYSQIADCDSLIRMLDGNWFESLAAHGVPRGVMDALDDAYEARVQTDEFLLYPFPDMPEVLERLSRRNSIVIITSSRGPAVRRFLTHHDVGGVTEIFGADHDTSKIRKIAEARSRHAGPDDKCWYVGDTAGDMVEALQAGATPIGVSWGWQDPERLLAAGASRLAREPRDLLFLE